MVYIHEAKKRTSKFVMNMNQYIIVNCQRTICEANWAYFLHFAASGFMALVSGCSDAILLQEPISQRREEDKHIC